MSAESTARRKSNESKFRALRKRNAKIAGKQPLRDPKYLAWIRTLECAVPNCTSRNLHQFRAAGAWTEAAHVGVRGLRQKCSDRETLSLCAWHHRLSPLSHHRAGKRFWKYHHLDREALIAAYNLAYEERES